MTEQTGTTLAAALEAGNVAPMPVRLSQEDKAAWCREGRVFDILGIEETKTPDNHFFTLRVEYNAEQYVLGFSATATRLQTLRDIATLLTNGPVRECRLDVIGGTAPNLAYGIVPA